ncbi:MAG: hypothetical protein QOJ27_608 [Sphingomonadales bacterium]|nr:hypothetical protein [Sphingomonadales bacterium]
MREVRWIGSSREDLMAMPREVVTEFGHGLYVAQMGDHPDGAKPLTGFGAAVFELIERHDGDTYRAVYTLRHADAIYVLHCFQKKSPRGSELPRPDRNLIDRRLKAARQDAEGRPK